MDADQIRSAGSATTHGFDLSPRAQAALVEVMACDGGTPAEVIERAALALRDETTDRTPKVSVELVLGWGTHAHASEIGRPRLTITGPGVRLSIIPAWDIPSADEVDALERVYEACGDAVHRFRAAYKVTDRHNTNGGNSMTNMDDGPEGPVQTMDPVAPTVDEVTRIGGPTDEKETQE